MQLYMNIGKDVYRWNAKEKDYLFLHRAARLCEAERDVAVGNRDKEAIRKEDARKLLISQYAFNHSERA